MSLAQNAGNFPREVELVFEYLQQHDYPEVFNNQPYQFRPVAWQIIDVDGDGVMEVFLQSFPHYRQSPTITIYQVDSKGSVSRLVEGLAPGPLVAVKEEDDYFDPHTTGTAMDMQLNHADPEKMKIFAKSSLKFGMSPVLYKNFIHTDKREGRPTFIDLSYTSYKEENACENFQFSSPDALAAGLLKGKKERCFIALVGEELYCYAIKGITDDGWLDKELVIIKKPADFKEFAVAGGNILYVTHTGKKKELIF